MKTRPERNRFQFAVRDSGPDRLSRWFWIALVGLVTVAASPHQTATRERTGRLQIEQWEAESLRGNLLGEPSEVRAIVYLPPGYDENSAARYPVIYVLSGIFDRADVWVDHFKIPELLNEMIMEQRVPASIVVFLGGRNRLGGGFYRNSPVSGNWGDLVAHELVTRIDSTYRTLDHRESRALAGHSMGGYGAIHAGMERPEVFATVYGISPCCLAPVEDLGQGNPVWGRIGALESWDQVKAAAENRDFYLVAGLGVLTAFLPNPDRPPFLVDVPYGVRRGESVILDPPFTTWMERFPLYRLSDRREALLSLRGLGLEYGITDQFPHIPTGSRRFSQRLAELRIPHLFEVYEGDHREKVRERMEQAILPFLARRLVTQ